MKLRNSRRGGTLDNIFVMAQLFGFAIFMLIIWLVWTEMTTSDMTEDIWDQTSQGKNIKANTEAGINKADFIFVMAYFGMHIGVIVLAFLLRSHPVVLVAGMFIVVIMAVIAAPLSNTWEDLGDEDILTSSLSELPMTDFIMLKLPLFEVVFAFVTLLAFAAFARMEAYI